MITERDLLEKKNSAWLWNSTNTSKFQNSGNNNKSIVYGSQSKGNFHLLILEYLKHVKEYPKVKNHQLPIYMQSKGAKNKSVDNFSLKKVSKSNTQFNLQKFSEQMYATHDKPQETYDQSPASRRAQVREDSCWQRCTWIYLVISIQLS